MVSIVLCDDEKSSLQINQIYVENYIEGSKIKAQVKAYLGRTSELEEQIRENIDIAFISADMMDKKCGLELAEQIQSFNNEAIIIFLTKQAGCSCEPYEIHTFGYLRKPIKETDINQILKQVIALYGGIHKTKMLSHELILGNRVLMENEILYFQKKRRVQVYTLHETFEVAMPLHIIEKKLSEMFFTVARGVTVNKKYILEINENVVIMANQKRFPIEAKKLPNVIAEYEEYVRKYK